jgi:RimJ/RimL family protein N-acetyltransferase
MGKPVKGGSPMTTASFAGKLVRLRVLDPEKDSEAISSWNRDSEYYRLADSELCTLYTAKNVKEWFERPDSGYNFMIHIQTDDKIIGFVGLDTIDWVSGDCWVGIAIGDRNCWGKGYGTEAMNLILNFAFRQLNLKRVSLSVFEYNPRAIRSYEKTGFRHEGLMRECIHRDGKRWDMLFMGILREEWEALQPDR